MKKSAARALADTGVSRRQTERLAIELPVSIRVPRRGAALEEETRTLDFSRGGASFTARRLYHVGMNLRISFLELPDFSPGMREIPAQVVRVRELPPGHGTAVAVQFGDMDRANLIFGELLRTKIRTSSALLGIIQALSPRAEIVAVIEDICRATERAM